MSQDATDPQRSVEDALDQAWRIHGAIVTWTSGVDSKASFALAIESGVMVAIIQLTASGRRLHHLHGIAELATFYVGVALLGVALICVALVVRPRLRTSKVAEEAAENLVFFGHVRKWNPTDLETALRERDLLPVLSRQLVNTSKVAWLKHRLLQWSMNLALVGVALVGCAALLVG